MSQEISKSIAAYSRFANYARAHGRTEAEQIAYDSVEFPGGKMAGFLIWNSQRLAEASQEIPRAFAGRARRLVDHDAYDAWLDARVSNIAKARGQ